MKAVIGAAAVLAVAGGGVAIGASQFGSPQDESKAIIDDVAGQLGVQPSALTNAFKKALANRVDAAVAAGQLTRAQGDELKKRIEANDSPLLLPGLGRGFGFDHHLGFGRFASLDAAATYLGLTEEQVRSRLADGKSLAQIAKDQGKSVDGLVDALVAVVKKRLDAEVTAGRLTKDKEESALKDIKTRITDLVNAKPGSLRGFGFRRDGFGLAPRGFGGFGIPHRFDPVRPIIIGPTA
jgi:hypothetical protein